MKYPRFSDFFVLSLLTTISAPLFLGCASFPGKTPPEQIEMMDDFVERTLGDLYKQNPNAKEEIGRSVGYVLMNNKITKIPVIGIGSGYGVAIENKSGKKTYLKMKRFDIGGGWGARSLRPVLIFHDEKKFKDVENGEWTGNFGAEAAAKVGEAGVAGAGGASDLKSDKGYTTHVLTDAGVSATVTFGIIRIKPVNLRIK